MKGVVQVAKITSEQIQKINNMCSNEWVLDTEYYVYHNEKTLIKHIRMNETNYLEFRLSYNYKNQISIHISNFYHKPEDTFASSSGMGKRKILDETQYKRKNINNLIELTKELNDTKLLEINKTTPLASGYGLIVESEDF